MTRQQPVSAAGLYLGAISGTSVDGLDLALIRIAADDTISIVAHTTAPFPPALAGELAALAQPGPNEVVRQGAADTELGAFAGTAINAFLADAGVKGNTVAAIGSHGQTIRHHPPGAGTSAFTVQIGDPNRIAEITGITTVADFRRRDMAAGGEGAPLVPPFHRALFALAGRPRAVLNIGGIGNVTVLSGDPNEHSLTGFDTGPGNALLDAWCDRHRGERWDADGAWARTGRVDVALLECLLDADDYLGRPPPKSTGKERYNLAWLDPLLATLRETPEAADVQATLTEFTARAAAAAVRRWAPDTAEILVCGGGRHNGLLMERLTALAPAMVAAVESVGVDGDALEAAAFGWLAAQALSGRPGNHPQVTGAAGFRVLGGIYPG